MRQRALVVLKKNVQKVDFIFHCWIMQNYIEKYERFYTPLSKLIDQVNKK